MMMPSTPTRSWIAWTTAIVLAGGIYLLALLLLTPDGVFLTGDTGLKALLTQNLAAGHFDFSLHSPDPPWVRALWIEGMYPYKEPYVYPLNGAYFIAWPYIFSLLTAPFYALFGYYGLYVVPALATFAAWLVFAWLARRLGLNAPAAAAGSAALIFGTYHTLYGALIWEHAVSASLAFAGWALLMPPRKTDSAAAEVNRAAELSRRAAAAAGVMTGLAVSLRGEQIFVVLVLDALCAWAIARPALPWLERFDLGRLPGCLTKAAWVYPLASTLTLLGYGLSNQLIYGTFLGVQSIQTVENRGLRQRLFIALDNLEQMTVGEKSLFLFAPIVLFPLLYLALAAIRRRRVPYQREWTAWYGLCVAIMLGAALLAPPGAGDKQWGPRFYLVLLPVLCLLAAWQLDSLAQQAGPGLRRAAWGLAALLVVLGVAQNPLRGTQFFITNYAEIAPAAQQLRTGTQPVVGIASQFVGQVLHPNLDPQAIVLLADNEAHLGRLLEAMLQNGQTTLTYICFPNGCPLIEKKWGSGDDRIRREDNYYRLVVTESGRYGKYAIFNVIVELAE